VSAAPSPADALLVEARGLTAAYGSSPALRGLDASIRAGEVAAVLGENGSGKSTFLKVVARVLRASGGTLRFAGRPLESMSRRETAQRVAYVPQSVDLVFPIRSRDLVLQGRAPYAPGFDDWKSRQPSRYEQGNWTADYVRMRFVAVGL